MPEISSTTAGTITPVRNFSFAGLKTSVLYYIRDNFKKSPNGSVILNNNARMDIAREFEDAVGEVLISKTKRAIEDIGVKTLIVAGGVIANKKLRESFINLENEYSELSIMIPASAMATDNAVMIGLATYINVMLSPKITNEHKKIVAEGNLTL